MDVGSIEFIHSRIVHERDVGTAVLLVSSELDEVYGAGRPDRGHVPGPDHRLPAAHGAGGGTRPADGRLRSPRNARKPPEPQKQGHRKRSRQERERAHERAGAAGSPGAPGFSGPATATKQKEKSGESRRSFGQTLRESILEGNTVTVIFLAIFTAIVIGGLLNAFTNTTVLHAWGNFFSAPGAAISQAWNTAIGAYVALFEGSIFNPHTVAALFQQASLGTAVHDGYLGAVFNPLSETCVQATPLLLTGLAVALPYQAGMFNIGAQSQFIGGAILAT